LVKSIQGKISELVKEVPSEAADLVKKFLDEAKVIASAKDFDYLLAKLKGTEVLKTVQTEEDVKELDVEIAQVKDSESQLQPESD